MECYWDIREALINLKVNWITLIRTVLDNEIKYALTEDGIKLGSQYFTETMI